MRIIVTGASGFVGPYAARSLRKRFATAHLVGASRNMPECADFDETLSLDICDMASVHQAVETVRPSHILHLAGIASPGRAAADPELAWRVNVFGTINVARTLIATAPDCIFGYVGSGLVYGGSARAGTPLDETALPDPLDDYSVTKMAADLAVGSLSRKGLRSIRLRPFNHIGPGQGEDYVVPAFAMQIARIEAGLLNPVLRVGNLEAERDFLDVRDVCDAYAIALDAATELQSGTVLNLASGQATRIRAILDTLLSFSDAAIQVEQDASRMRPSDVPTMLGDAARAHQIGWRPRRALDDTLREILDDCRRQVRQEMNQLR